MNRLRDHLFIVQLRWILLLEDDGGSHTIQYQVLTSCHVLLVSCLDSHKMLALALSKRFLI